MAQLHRSLPNASASTGQAPRQLAERMSALLFFWPHGSAFLPIYGVQDSKYTPVMPHDRIPDAPVLPSAASHPEVSRVTAGLALRRAKPRTKPDWPLPASLIALSLVPVVAGAVRVVGLSGGEEMTPSNARFFADPVPAVLHILSASVFCILGAFQFSPGFRRRKPHWHRAAGRLLVPLGLLAALSSLWLTLFYPNAEHAGIILYSMRLVVGSAMAACLCMAVVALRRRDYPAHGAWMTRGYALGLGAGTQVLTNVSWLVFVGPVTEHSFALMMGAGWAMNIAVAEWVIRRQRNVKTARSAATAGVPHG